MAAKSLVRSGDKFGDLTIVEELTTNGNRKFSCLCVCGKSRTVWLQSLKDRNQCRHKVPGKVPPSCPIGYEELRDLYEVKLLNAGQIAKKYGVARDTAKGWVFHCGFRITEEERHKRLRNNLLSKREERVAEIERRLSEIKTLRENGESIKKIGRHLGYSAEILGPICRKHGLELTTATEMKTTNGYILERRFGHPNAAPKGWVPQHRLIVEKHIGRFLDKREVVHHINFIKADNRLENLALFPSNRAHHDYHWRASCYGAFSLGHTHEPPEDMTFDEPILWGGEWVTKISFNK